MNKIRLTVLPLLLVLLAGCVTSRPLQFAPVNLDQATVYLYNDACGFPMGARAHVAVNGVPIATLSYREYTWLFVPPGIMQVSIYDPRKPGQRVVSRQFVVQRGKPYHIAYKNVRYTEVEVAGGKTYVPVETRVTTIRGKDLLWVRESDGIAMTQTHRLVTNESPWGGVGSRFETARITERVGFVK